MGEYLCAATKVNNCLNIVQTGGQPAGNPMSVKVHFNVSKCAACTSVEIKRHIITMAGAIKFREGFSNWKGNMYEL